MLKKKKNKYKTMLLITAIVSTIIILLGSTYAFFTYSKAIDAYVITSGKINAVFTEGTNSISFTNAYPISEDYALNHLNELEYVDFTVSTETVSETDSIGYQIYLTEDVGNTLSSDYVKVYLTDTSNSVIVNPTTYSALGYTTYPEKSSTGRVIYTDSNTGACTKTFRLYTWVDSTYEQNIVSQIFSFKVNLYAYNV